MLASDFSSKLSFMETTFALGSSLRADDARGRGVDFGAARA
jgi:hypothetical protein